LGTKLKIKKENLGISVILILSIILNFANLGIEGYANTFYSAGVKSMLMSFKNFFFASFDPAGFVTIDKPPVGFWLQAMSAKIFGFSGWSVILPQALAGVISVAIIYHLVKKAFGIKAGLVSAFCLAVTPIFVASSRNNTIDNLLVMFLLLACWAALIACENGRLNYLLLSLVLVGIGFNIKMVEAYMVAPAIYITYLLASKISLKKRIKSLFLGTIVLLVVSLSWAVVTDLVPSSNRPYIGSSTNNSVIQLIIGHNGLERIGLGRKYNSKDKSQNRSSTNQIELGLNEFQKKLNSSNKNSRNNMQNSTRNNSNTGIIRLFNKDNMSDQISWLLLFAIIGFFAAAMHEKLKAPFDTKRKLSLILWITWLIPEFIYFSFSRNVTHTYYLTTMAPSIAALTGIGFSTMWQFFKQKGAKAWFLPISLIANGCIEILILSYNYNSSSGYKILILITIVLCILSSAILCIVNLTKNTNESLTKSLVIIALVGILAAPTVWSFTPIFYQMNGNSPSAGLELARNNRNSESNVRNDSKLIKFLESNRKNEKYLVMVPSATSYGSNLILETGEPVMALGGFSGSDPILTLGKFKKLVIDGKLRYALINTSNIRSFGENSSNNSITNWIKENGKVIPTDEWKSSNTSNNQRQPRSFSNQNDSMQLYDLKRFY